MTDKYMLFRVPNYRRDAGGRHPACNQPKAVFENKPVICTLKEGIRLLNKYKRALKHVPLQEGQIRPDTLILVSFWNGHYIYGRLYQYSCGYDSELSNAIEENRKYLMDHYIRIVN